MAKADHHNGFQVVQPTRADNPTPELGRRFRKTARYKNTRVPNEKSHRPRNVPFNIHTPGLR